MSENYGQWFEKFKELTDGFDSDELYESFRSMLSQSKSTISLNRKIMEKTIDVSWVETIEAGLVHIDNVMRNPRKTIVNVEEVVPIALSKKITVDSIKHLAQHTDLIQSVDPKTGKITPSKVLNVHKEESMLTYENKFVNTLIDRLYIFINRRYEKLKAVTDDEEVFSMEYNTVAETNGGSSYKMTVKIETADSLEKTDENGSTLWQRVEKIRQIIESYKASPFCQQMGNNYIRPPVMRTNAIMKNVELKACLMLWQFIESYDKVGYEINVSDSAQKPEDNYIENLYSVAAVNFLLFRVFTAGEGKEGEVLKTKKTKAAAPRIIRKFDKAGLDKYNVLESDARETAENGAYELPAEPPENLEEMLDEIDRIIEIETEYFKEEERKRIEAEKREQKRLEEQRKREEEERIAREKAEEEERERQEKERLEQERLEKERLEKERAEREEQQRQQREREEREKEEKLRREREELGIAIAEQREIAEAENRAIREKEDEQRREKEEREKVRAEKLKKMRNYLETKPFEEIYPEYSKNPVYVISRQVRRIISNIRMDGSYICEGDTSEPMLIERFATEEANKRQAEREREEAAEMEKLYSKYIPNRRQKFEIRRKKRLDKKKKKIYKMPAEPPIQRSPEEQKAYDKMMNEIFRKYRVSSFEKAKRKFKEIQMKIIRWKNQKGLY